MRRLGLVFASRVSERRRRFFVFVFRNVTKLRAVCSERRERFRPSRCSAQVASRVERLVRHEVAVARIELLLTFLFYSCVFFVNGAVPDALVLSSLHKTAFSKDIPDIIKEARIARRLAKQNDSVRFALGFRG